MNGAIVTDQMLSGSKITGKWNRRRRRIHNGAEKTSEKFID